MRLLVLLYHHVGPNSAGLYPSLTVSPGLFEEQLRWLARRGYVGIRPSDWLRWRREGTALPAKPVLLTFDDGYADVAEYALPLLRSYGFGASVFIVTGRVGGTNTWDEAEGSGTQRLMTSEQIRYWATQQIEFGSHSRTHADLTTLAETKLDAEVTGSGNELSNILGTRVISFAYPYGHHSEVVRQRVEHTYDLAFTVDEGVNGRQTDLLLLKRTMVWPSNTTLDLAFQVRWGWSPLRRFRTMVPLRSVVPGVLRHISRG